MNIENSYTSTGDKLRLWGSELNYYAQYGCGNPICTHISPTSTCNLKCSYCSVANRTSHNTIEVYDIINYIDVLRERGLRSVILTGGGEPLFYGSINELLNAVFKRKLKCGLITNGTCFNRVDPDFLKQLTWVRVSLNIEALDKIEIPYDTLADATIGASLVVGKGFHESEFDTIESFIDTQNFKYIRVLPDCCNDSDTIDYYHEKIRYLLSTQANVNHPYFHQNKNHGVPSESWNTCPMGYFRPYLSEEINHKGFPGTVFPCDSVVLNTPDKKFLDKYAICAVDEIKEYTEGKIHPHFKPCEDCKGCVFTKNLKVIEDHLELYKVQHHEFI